MPVRKLSVAQAAYLAGLVDGEGTVTLTRRHVRERRQLVVSVCSTEPQLLQWILSAFCAGKITRKRVVSARHATAFTYSVSNRQALHLLAEIHPYLQSYKRERAALALDHYVRLTPRNGRYSEAIDRARQTFELQFLELKARGRVSAEQA